MALFLQRPGLVTYHIQHAGSLAATLSVHDLAQEAPAMKTLFRDAKKQAHGYPALSPSMGGGLSILVADRFQVEVVSLEASVGEKRRDAWLGAVDYPRLVALARK